MSPPQPVACTIAGSDSGGGAGIQADLKTFADLGVRGTSVVTAITAQNPCAVLGVHLVPEKMVALQLRAVLEGFDVRSFKTGMLGTAGIVRAVAAVLPAGIPLVVDPVIQSTSGTRLLDEKGEKELVAGLIPRSTVVTPNIPEAEHLSGMTEISTNMDMIEAALRIRRMGPEYVIVKGGHRPGPESVDLLVGPDTELFLGSPRISGGMHGSGCCFSAALAGYMAQGFDVVESFRKTKKYMDRVLGAQEQTS